MKVLLVILLILILLALIPLGVMAVYSEEGFSLALTVGPLRFRLFPRGEKKSGESKEKKARKKKEPEAEKKKEPFLKGGPLTQIQALLPLVEDTLSALKKRINVHTLELQVTWAASNPADAATGFGYASAALGALWAFLQQHFNVRHPKLGCDVDFDASSPAVYLRSALSITVGQIFTLVIPLAIRFFIIESRLSKEYSEKSTKKEA